MSDDDYEPYQWQPGDPADWGDGICSPDIPYMGYLNGDDDDDDDYRPPEKSKSEILNDEAWALRQDGRPEEALAIIERALELNGRNSNNWNVKAIILEDMARYDEAIECYDQALAIAPYSKVIKNNKSYSLSRLAYLERFGERNWQKALDLINEAISLRSDDEDKSEYLRIKANALDGLGKRVDAHVCCLLASGMTDRVEEINRKRKIMKETMGTLINITGTRFYSGLAPFSDNRIVNLVREPENEHDSDAIRVEIDGETVGYVANSPFTLIDEVKSATDIKDFISPHQKAKVMFVFADEYVIAKLV